MSARFAIRLAKLLGDNRGVSRVVFKVDGTTLNTESYVPWNCTFDSSKVKDGKHTLTATAYDAAGNSRSLSIAVTVASAVAPPPTPGSTPTPTPSPSPTPTPSPEPTPTPSPSPTGMIVVLDAGNYGSSGATDVRGAVNTVRYDSERGVTTLETSRKPVCGSRCSSPARTTAAVSVR